MGQFDVKGLDELINFLEKLGKTDDIAPKMLEEAAPILENEVIRQAKPHWDSGDMVKSIAKTRVRKGAKGDHYICVRPTGTSQRNGKTIRNMEKLVYLEFGVKGRAAIPILRTAVLNAAPEVKAKMKEVFQREVDAL